MKDLVQIRKFLSLVLRHKPEIIHLNCVAPTYRASNQRNDVE
jgi:RNA:NAD 2'-phosphotransferase (TPT1/KptA family)